LSRGAFLRLVATEFLDASVTLDELGFEESDSLLLLLVLSSEFLLRLGSFVFLDDGLELLCGLGGGDEAWGEVDGLGIRGLSVEPLIGRQSGLVGGGWWVEIVLEDVGLTGDLEGDGLNSVGGELKESGNLTNRDINGELGEHSHTTLRSGGLEFAEVVDVGILVDDFVVTDVTVTLSGEVEDASVVIVEGHEDTRGSIDVGGAQRLGEVAGLPERVLSLRGLGESHGENLVARSKEGNTHSLNSLVSLSFSDNASRTWVNASDLLVLAGSGEERTVVVPGDGLKLKKERH